MITLTEQIELAEAEAKSLSLRQIVELGSKEVFQSTIRDLEEKSKTSIPSWGYKDFDETLGLLLPGQLYVLGGITGTGKSTFLRQICLNVVDQGFRVSQYTLEDKIETVKQNDLYYAIMKSRRSQGFTMIPKWQFMAGVDYQSYKKEVETFSNIIAEKQKNLFLLKHPGSVTISDIENMITKAADLGSKLIAIDHLHYFDDENKTNERQDLVIKDTMHRINQIARERGICVILVAHYRKLTPGTKPTLSDFSGSISIAQLANGIIHIWRDKGDDDLPTEFIIDKNRDMGVCKTIYGTFSLKDYEYMF